MGETFEGRCTCGAVRYRMGSRPLIVHACHCSECRRLTGAAFALNALIEVDRVEVIAGEPEAVPVAGTSGRDQVILRCPGCWVALWSHYPGFGANVAFVRVGTLAEPDRLPPDIHIFTGSKLPWLELPKGAVAVAEFYDVKETWPPDSLERLTKLRKTEA